MNGFCQTSIRFLNNTKTTRTQNIEELEKNFFYYFFNSTFVFHFQLIFSVVNIYVKYSIVCECMCLCVYVYVCVCCMLEF